MDREETGLATLADIGLLSCPLVEVTNPELKEHTLAIVRHSNGIKTSMFAICAHLLIIKDRALYKDDGFSGIGDYAEKVLGYRPSTVANMIKVARSYLVPGDDGEYHTIFQRPDGSDYTLNQLIECKSFPTEYITVLNATGEIAPDMSVRAIREVIKSKRDEQGLTKGRKRTKSQKASDVKSEVANNAKVVDNVEMCLLRIVESIPVLMAADRYKEDQDLMDALNRVLELLA